MLPLSDQEKYCEDIIERTRNDYTDDNYATISSNVKVWRLLSKIKDQLERNIAEAEQKKKQEELKNKAMEEQKTKDKSNFIKLKEDLAKLDFKGILLERSTVGFYTVIDFGNIKSLKRYNDCVAMIEEVIQDWYDISDKEFYTILNELLGPYSAITSDLFHFTMSYILFQSYYMRIY